MSKKREIDNAITATVSLMKDQGCVKCPRCRRWGIYHYNHDQLCERCMYVIATEFKEHESYPLILKNLEERGLTLDDVLANKDGIRNEL